MQGVYRNQKVILHIFVLAAWIKIKNADSSLITASVGDKDSEELCVGTVDAKPGCWSFLKGGFVASKLNLSSIYLKVYLLVALSILTHTSSNLNLLFLMNKNLESLQDYISSCFLSFAEFRSRSFGNRDC